MIKEIKTKKQLLEALKPLPINSESHRNSIICSLIGHSNICTICFGYRYCGRCGDQLGDSLGSVDSGAKDCVIIGHNCQTCQVNYKKSTWKDKLYVQPPFTKNGIKSEE